MAKKEEKISKEDRFYEIVKDLTPKIDKNKYPDSVFYFKGDDLLFEIENSTIRVSNKRVWSLFEEEYLMDHIDTEEFISIMVKEHFKGKGLTGLSWRASTGHLVEEHFKEK